MHEKAVVPFLDYFRSSDRMVSINVSSGAMEPIWDKVHVLFTDLHLQAWRPVDSVLVFAMGEGWGRGGGGGSWWGGGGEGEGEVERGRDARVSEN